MPRDPYTHLVDVTDLPLFGPAPARATDPETSHKAALHVTRNGQRASERDLTERELRWFVNTYKYFPTSSELAGGNQRLRYMYGRRLPELEHRGIVKKGPERRDRNTGRESVTWEPV